MGRPAWIRTLLAKWISPKWAITVAFIYLMLAGGLKIVAKLEEAIDKETAQAAVNSQ